MPVLLTIRETAHVLDVSVARVRQLRYERKLTAYKNPLGRLRFDESEVRSLKAERESFHEMSA